MRVHVVRAVLHVVFGDDDQRVGRVAAVGDRLHDLPERGRITGGRDMRASNGSGGTDAYRALGRSGTVVRVSASHGF